MNIINTSYREQQLPACWKMADVSPLPKKKPVKDLKKDLRPISLFWPLPENVRFHNKHVSIVKLIN